MIIASFDYCRFKHEASDNKDTLKDIVDLKKRNGKSKSEINRKTSWG